MKFNELNSLKNQKQFPQIFLILSKESQEQKYSTEEILSLLKSRLQLQNVYLKNINGEDFSLADFKNEIETRPFLSSHTFVHVNQIEKIPTQELKELIPLMNNLMPWVYCFFSGSHLPSQTLFFKMTDEKGWIFQKAEEKSWEKEKKLANWISDLAKAQGKSLDQKNSHFFLKYCGTERDWLRSELYKITNYVGNRIEILESDIRAICLPIASETLWQLGDAIFQLEKANAITYGHNLLQEGNTIFSMLAQLRSQFQNSYQILSLYKEKGAAAVSSAFPYLKGGFLEKKIQIITHFGVNRLKQGLLTLHEAEFESRNNSIEPETFFDLLILHLIHGTSITSISKSSWQG